MLVQCAALVKSELRFGMFYAISMGNRTLWENTLHVQCFHATHEEGEGVAAAVAVAVAVGTQCYAMKQ